MYLYKLSEQECNEAEKYEDKCEGYLRWNTNKPIEQCRKCVKYNFYKKDDRANDNSIL